MDNVNGWMSRWMQEQMGEHLCCDFHHHFTRVSLWRSPYPTLSLLPMVIRPKLGSWALVTVLMLCDISGLTG